VDLSFESRRLQRLCNEWAAMTARWGERRARAVAQGLDELDALDTLGDVAALPHVHVEPSSAGRITVHAAGGFRIVLRPDEQQGSDGQDLDSISSVVVVDVAVTGGLDRRRARG
jgi:hypothetical protein